MEIHLHESLKVSLSVRWLGERHEDIRVTPSTLHHHCANLSLGDRCSCAHHAATRSSAWRCDVVSSARSGRLRGSDRSLRDGSELGSEPLTRTPLLARWLDMLEHLLQRMMADILYSPADLALGYLLDQYSSANLRPNLHIAVHPSPVSLVDSLGSQLVSRDCWVLLFSMRRCCYLRCAFTRTRPRVASGSSFQSPPPTKVAREKPGSAAR